MPTNKTTKAGARTLTKLEQFVNKHSYLSDKVIAGQLNRTQRGIARVRASLEAKIGGPTNGR
jgi:hypothetical protein